MGTTADAERIDLMNAALAEARERFFTASSPDRPPATDEQRKVVADLNGHIVGLAQAILLTVPPGRNRSLALTALEDVSMRANRAVFATGPDA